MRSLPTISLVTACYNSADTIQDCLKSISTQDYPYIEHIIIDGRSSDGTLNLISQYKSNNCKIISEKDDGIYDALNKGLKAASGDIIGFLHSDDILAHDKVLSNISKSFQDNSELECVYGNLIYVDRNNIECVIRRWTPQPFTASLLKYGWMPPHPTVFLKKGVYEKNGHFDTNMKISADYDFMLRYFKIAEEYKTQKLGDISIMKSGGASNRNLSARIQSAYEDYIAIRRNRAGNILTLVLKKSAKIFQYRLKGTYNAK